MTLTRLTADSYKTSRWSGGTTTELLIRPRGAVYGDRDFLFRISSATVDLEESLFTALPDYDRLIATLEGTITLSHDGGAPLTLEPFQVHAFDGGSRTLSLGRCRDFNLMLRKGKASGSVASLPVTGRSVLRLDADTGTALLFCACGSCSVSCSSETFRLSSGESLLMDDVSGEEPALQGEPSARLMLVQIRRM